MKHIYLSVDDNNINEWFNGIDYLNDNNIKLTFFLSHLNKFSENEWYKIKRLSEVHSIQLHGVNHLRAGVCDLSIKERKELKKTVHNLSWKKFMEDEIWRGIELIIKHTSKSPNHYSYPMGNRTDNSDAKLLRIFETLKRGGGGVYDIDNFPNVYGSLMFDKLPDKAFSGHERKASSIKDGQVFCCYMHHPIKKRLDWLIDLNYKFVTIEDIANGKY